MSILYFGVSHCDAPVALRERVAFSATQVAEALLTLSDTFGSLEVALLSTCNRTEFYVAGPGAAGAQEALTAFLVESHGLDPEAVRLLFRQLTGTDAVSHLLRVASGLESQILGEGQILGQVRQAHAAARAAGTLGPVLDSLFRHAVGAGKRVRTETTITKGAVSIGASAIELARQQLGGLAGRTVLLLGAGKIGEATLKHLSGQGVRKVLVANRTFESALELARSCGGQAVPFHALSDAWCEADVVLVCTGAPHFILTRADLAPLMASREDRRLLVVDISVPRNIDPAIEGLAGVDLFDIDALSSLADRNLTERQAQAPQAERIVDEETERFGGWQRSYQAAPTIASLRHKLDGLRQTELDRFLARHGALLTPEQQEAVTQLTRAIANKFLHEPTVGLKAQTGAKREAHASVIRELFHLQLNRPS